MHRWFNRHLDWWEIHNDHINTKTSEKHAYISLKQPFRWYKMQRNSKSFMYKALTSLYNPPSLLPLSPLPLPRPTSPLPPQKKRISLHYSSTAAWTKTIYTKRKKKKKITFLLHILKLTKHLDYGKNCTGLSIFWHEGGRCMLRSSKLGQQWMLNPCSLAKCRRQMKHNWGEISSGAAARQSTGNVAKTCLKDIASLLTFNKGKKIYM